MSGRIIDFENKPNVISYASVVGKKEGEGPLGKFFDMILEDVRCGLDTWEKAESHIQKIAVGLVLDKSGKKSEEIDGIFAGDLINQCTGSAFGIREFGIPYFGVYGACSTSVLAMINAAVYVDSGKMDTAISSTSSHFCSAEKQFRFPLEYGGQRPPTAQWTVTGAGAAMISSKNEKNSPKIEKAILGKMVDKGVTDASNMGAAMAPAAADTIAAFLTETQTAPEHYDLILTGDLGKVGSKLLYDLLEKEYNINIREVHNDTGLMMYYPDKQDVHAGGSGCGCCGSILCSKILKELSEGKRHRVFVVATGALLSAVSPFQGESIPGIAHGILLTDGR